MQIIHSPRHRAASLATRLPFITRVVCEALTAAASFFLVSRSWSSRWRRPPRNLAANSARGPSRRHRTARPARDPGGLSRVDLRRTAARDQAGARRGAGTLVRVPGLQQPDPRGQLGLAEPIRPASSSGRRRRGPAAHPAVLPPRLSPPPCAPPCAGPRRSFQPSSARSSSSSPAIGRRGGQA
jgi:hypothetical protein